jgi:hypothetical protein
MEDFNSRNEGYVVETPDKFVAVDFKNVKLPDGCPPSLTASNSCSPSVMKLMAIYEMVSKIMIQSCYRKSF